MEIASAAPESQLANLRRSADYAGRTRYRDSIRSRWQMGCGFWEMSGDSVAWSQLCSRAYLWCLRLISVLRDTKLFLPLTHQPIYVLDSVKFPNCDIIYSDIVSFFQFSSECNNTYFRCSFQINTKFRKIMLSPQNMIKDRCAKG